MIKKAAVTVGSATKAGPISFPEFTLGIEVTKRCNFTCRHCFVDAGRPDPEELTTEELKHVLDQAAKAGVKTIGWSGGEPLLRKDLAELTAHARSLTLSVTLVSNGFLATPQRLSGLRSAGLSVVQISLDGNTRERAGRFRRGPAAAFDRAVRAVQNSAAAGLTTYVCALLAPETAGEIAEMMAFARSLGAHGLRYATWTPVGRARGAPYDERAWGGEDMRRFLNLAWQAQIVGGFPVIIDCPGGPLPWNNLFKCRAGEIVAYITSRGDVYPCTSLVTPGYLAGNVRTRPLLKILRSAALRKVRRKISRSLPRGACAGCFRLKKCRGGCPGRTIAQFGRLKKGPHKGAMPACLARLHPPPC